jgi:hypothetical protein
MKELVGRAAKCYRRGRCGEGGRSTFDAASEVTYVCDYISRFPYPTWCSGCSGPIRECEAVPQRSTPEVRWFKAVPSRKLGFRTPAATQVVAGLGVNRS